MRPIDADKVIDALDDAGIELYPSEYEEFQAQLDKMPTIDPESLRPTAHWIQCDLVLHDYDDGTDTIYSYRGLGRKCSRCAQIYDATKMDIKKNFCPNCGAKMMMPYYRGYTTTIEYDEDDKLWHGTLDGIKDLVNFHAFEIKNIEQEFHNAVDDYLDFCKEVGKEPERPQP